METKYEPVIGLEIHVELKTKNKMFCQCDADYFEKEPNSNTCPVCLGMPGALPVPNKKAIEWTMLIGVALKCKIKKVSKFDRKHYFYPDLPKGYQISQYDAPFSENGYVEIEDKKFRIRRVHLEEDTGKLIHAGEETLVDFNRSGVPLVEIVTEPDFDNSSEVKRFLEELHVIIKEHLKVSDANMERGDMRLEPNISVRKVGEKEIPKYKVEVKNINSFRFVQKAIDYEIKRQTEILEKGEIPTQETRGYDEDKGKTFSQRTKEEAHDYRYFPEPDIPPFEISNEYIENIKKQLPELPQTTVRRFINQGVSPQVAFTLTRISGASTYYENLNRELDEENIPNLAQGTANLIVNRKIDINVPVEENIKTVKDKLLPKKTDPNLLNSAIEKVIRENSKAVEDFRGGKETVLMFLIGKIMKELKGEADAQKVKNELIERLK